MDNSWNECAQGMRFKSCREREVSVGASQTDPYLGLIFAKEPRSAISWPDIGPKPVWKRYSSLFPYDFSDEAQSWLNCPKQFAQLPKNARCSTTFCEETMKNVAAFEHSVQAHYSSVVKFRIWIGNFTVARNTFDSRVSCSVFKYFRVLPNAARQIKPVSTLHDSEVKCRRSQNRHYNILTSSQLDDPTIPGFPQMVHAVSNKMWETC